MLFPTGVISNLRLEAQRDWISPTQQCDYVNGSVPLNAQARSDGLQAGNKKDKRIQKKQSHRICARPSLESSTSEKIGASFERRGICFGWQRIDFTAPSLPASHLRPAKGTDKPTQTIHIDPLAPPCPALTYKIGCDILINRLTCSLLPANTWSPVLCKFVILEIACLNNSKHVSVT